MTFSAEDIQKVAASGRVANVIVGRYNKAGDIFRINIELRHAENWELISGEQEECQGDEGLFDAVDNLTKKIKTQFSLSKRQVAGDVDRDVKEFFTSSPEALKHYLEGRKYHHNQEYRLGIEFFKKAVKEDPEFAAAYRMIGVAYSNRGSRYDSERDEYLQKAYDLREKASEREKYLIMGSYFNRSDETYTECVEAYKKLLELYPDCGPGNNNLAMKYFEVQDFESAIKHLEVNRRKGGEGLLGYNNLAKAYQYIGEYDKATQVLEEFLATGEDKAYAHYLLANNYLFQGDYEKALEEVDKANVLRPGWISKYLPLFLSGDMDEGEKELESILNRESDTRKYNYFRSKEIICRTRGRFNEAINWAQKGLKFAEEKSSNSYIRIFRGAMVLDYLIQGKISEAAEEANLVLQNALENQAGGEISGRFYRMLVLLEKNDLTEAENNAEKVRQLVEDDINPNRIRTYYNHIGMIALKKKEYKRAVEYLEKTLDLSWQPAGWISPLASMRYHIGIAHFEDGEMDKAQESFEKVIGMSVGRFLWGHLYTKSFYMLGRIYEQQNNTAKAIENYGKFLEILKNADPEMAELEDAKKRVSILINY
jgi:tetratricopeptide (TPR) repeat protein